jgi:hypothetical protein
VIGDTDKGREAVIRPESMALAAQLATEIALRWIKRQTEEFSNQPGESLARSSQNLG